MIASYFYWLSQFFPLPAFAVESRLVYFIFVARSAGLDILYQKIYQGMVFDMSIHVHPTAEVSPQAILGEGCRIWHHAQVREGARLGNYCIIGKGVYIDAGVIIGDHVKIQNYASVYQGVMLEDGVFVGPHVCFTNDRKPRAINPDGSLKSADDWVLNHTLVKRGAALGANAVIVCGITIGAWAMVGAGSVVTQDVPDYGLVWGNPARLHGFVCPCGSRLELGETESESSEQEFVVTRCTECGNVQRIPKQNWERIE